MAAEKNERIEDFDKDKLRFYGTFKFHTDIQYCFDSNLYRWIMLIAKFYGHCK